MMMMLMVATAVLERLRMSWGRDLTSAPDSNRSVLRLTCLFLVFLLNRPACMSQAFIAVRRVLDVVGLAIRLVTFYDPCSLKH